MSYYGLSVCISWPAVVVHSINVAIYAFETKLFLSSMATVAQVQLGSVFDVIGGRAYLIVFRTRSRTIARPTRVIIRQEWRCTE